MQSDSRMEGVVVEGAGAGYRRHVSAIVDEGAVVGEGTMVWHFSHVVAGAVVGKRCSLGQNVVVMNGAVIGDGCRIQNNVSVYTGVTLSDDVFIGPSAVFTNVVNPRAFVSRKSEYRQTVVGRGASIGANATIVCGNSIGEYALIGAGCVITHDVPAYGLMMGIPARQVGWVSRYGHRLEFDSEGVGVCPETGERYVLRGDWVELEKDI